MWKLFVDLLNDKKNKIKLHISLHSINSFKKPYESIYSISQAFLFQFFVLIVCIFYRDIKWSRWQNYGEELSFFLLHHLLGAKVVRRWKPLCSNRWISRLISVQHFPLRGFLFYFSLYLFYSPYHLFVLSLNIFLLQNTKC